MLLDVERDALVRHAAEQRDEDEADEQREDGGEQHHAQGDDPPGLNPRRSSPHADARRTAAPAASTIARRATRS